MSGNGLVQTGTINININIVGDGIIPPNTPLESAEIQRLILENPAIQHALRTIENTPAAIFRMTKGTDGPPCLRNVTKNERCRVFEGDATHTTLEYSKAMAMRMIQELQQALKKVTADSSPAVREWAKDVRAKLNATVVGANVSYTEALRLYCETSKAFYNIPEEHRTPILQGAKSITDFIKKEV